MTETEQTKCTTLRVRGPRRAANGLTERNITVLPGAPRVAIYCRTSALHQSIESQLGACRRHCERARYAVIQEFIEEGHTGHSPYLGPGSSAPWDTVFARPLFRLMLNQIMLYRPFDRIVCWSSDRLDRLGGWASVNLQDALSRNGVQLEFVHETAGLLLDLVDVETADE